MNMAGQQSAAPCERLWQKSNSPKEIPIQHFFKTILQSTIEDKKLKLPLKFVRRYEHELSDVAKLTVSKGQVWQARLTKGRNNIWFDDGWHEFAKFYSLCSGYFLVFKYKGMSNFNVYIFNTTTCEIPYPVNVIESDDDDEDSLPNVNNQNKQMEDDDCFEISGSAAYPSTRNGKSWKKKRNASERNLHRFTSGSHCLGINKRPECFASTDDQHEDKRKGKKCKKEEEEVPDLDGYDSPTYEKVREIYVTRNFDKLFSKLPPESQRAVIAAKKYYKSKNPAFMIVIQLQSKRSMYVPAEFSSKYLSRIYRDKVTLRISDGKEWFLRPFWRDCGGPIFTEGWSSFSHNNGLSLGDVCVFELIDLKNIVFKASIFHACLE